MQKQTSPALEPTDCNCQALRQAATANEAAQKALIDALGSGSDATQPQAAADAAAQEYVRALNTFTLLLTAADGEEIPAVSLVELGIVRDLRERGIRGVTVRAHEPVPATRLDPAAPVVRAAEVSIAETVGREPAVEPNLGGTIPNAVFADQLGLPTVWIPHSPPGVQPARPG